MDMDDEIIEIQPRNKGVPDPNQHISKANGEHVNYNQNASSGAKVTNGRAVGERVQYGNTSGRPINMNQQQQRRNPQQGNPQRRNPQVNRQNIQRQRVNANPQMQGVQQVQQQMNNQSQVQNVPPKKKNKLLPILGVLVVLAIVGVVVFMKMQPKPAPTNYKKSGKYALDNLAMALKDYDADKLDKVVGTKDGDSYLAQEWAYVNNIELRQNYIKKITGVVQFKYPMVNQTSTDGRVIKKNGNPVQIESEMNNGESVTVTIPNYKAIAEQMDKDKDYIAQMYTQAGYKPEDYTYSEEMATLYCQYIDELKIDMPTTTVEMKPEIRLSTDGTPYVESDSELDELLFSSDDVHNAMAKFSQAATGYTGKKLEKYQTREPRKNPDYKKWYKLFNKYYEADHGKFHKGVSKWEPWYKRDKNNKILKNEKGEKIVNYYSVKKKDGTDWIEPAETVNIKVTKTREVDDTWVEETGVMYNWIGAYYIQNKYNGTGDKTVRVGDGTRNNPAGVGTTIVTKAIGTDGKFHDVRVALKGYWIGQDAIDYAEAFDTRNRGFIASSSVQLICYEVQIENLENRDITIVPDMTLANANSDVSARTGTMFGFTEKQKIKAHEKVIINDWATSTELEQKYVCWGKSFNRQYAMIYFNILAGSGNIPKYSAYEYFTGKSEIDENVDVHSDTTQSTTNTTDDSSDTTQSTTNTTDDSSSTSGQ